MGTNAGGTRERGPQIWSLIVNMTTIATTTCSSNILDVLNNMINGNK
jgi:hypothetical protein